MNVKTKRVCRVLLLCLLAALFTVAAAVTVSAATEVTSGSLDTSKTYIVGAENSGYTLVYSGGWKIKNSSDSYMQVNYGSITWGNTASTFTVTPGSSGATISCSMSGRTYYLAYNNGFSANMNSSNRIHVYATESSGGESGGTTPSGSSGSSTVTLYFTNNKRWTSVNAYVWNDETQTEEATWPGTTLTKQLTNDYNEDIYSVTIDYTAYDHVIFNDGSEQTVDINVLEAVENGGGIFLTKDENNDFVTDTSGHYQVSYYNHAIDFSKKIEKLQPADNDDYTYRLHLNVEGKNLTGSTTIPGQPVTDRKIGILMDVTETMLSTWSGSDTGDNKFDGVRQLLQGSDGFLNSILDGHTEVYIIVVGGQTGTGTYLQLSDKIASGTTPGDFSNINNSLHVSQGISYVTGLKAAEYYLGNDIDSLVYIIGNETDTYVDYASGNVERGTTGSNAKTKNYNDYVTFMGNHPNLSMYTVYVTPVNRGTDIAQQMGEYSVNRGTGGGYYEASDTATLKEKLTQISEAIQLPGDKTKNLTVTDTLSEYVDFLDAASINLTATMTLEGETVGTDVSSYVTVDRTNKTVTFSGYPTIDGRFTLDIAFNIRTADDVFHDTAKYGNTGYPHTGDADTDYGTNTTSSNQPGYYSNVKESSTVSYTLNSEPERTAEFLQPVVQAPEPQDGTYKFVYPDRDPDNYYGDGRGSGEYFGSTDWTKTVTRRLRSAEIRGYSGNGNKPGVPTYLWTEEAQTLFDFNPLVTASLSVTNNTDADDNVSFYKNEIIWPDMTLATAPNGITVDENSNVVVTATAEEKTFTLKYVVNNTEKAESGIPYAKAATFNPIYEGSTKYYYIAADLPGNITYWSSDAAGENILTTVKTFGMLVRGGYTPEDVRDDVVTVYAQTTPPPEGDEWRPFIEEATLTRVIADEDVNTVYVDYMVDYLNINGEVVQKLVAGGSKVNYGLVVMVYDEAMSEANMQKVAKLMIDNDKTAANIADTQHKAYRYEYSDATHISDYNRTLYTINGDYEKLNGKTLTAIAYLYLDEDKSKIYYSKINQAIIIKKDDEGEE